MKEISELKVKLDNLEPLLEVANDEKLNVLSKFLAERINSPESFVTFLGETSSGKSTLINGLIGKPLLPMKASPTTGAICEIMLKADRNEDAFFAINKDATIEALSKSECISLIEAPDKKLSRVRIVTSSPESRLTNLRIFDTPGYDSIVSEHEEILKEFLPNSDVVIYTVSYKIGIQENDYAFLGFMKELLRDDVDIIIVINRCPPGTGKDDRRIREIRQYMKDILLTDVMCFTVEAETAEDGDYPLPYAKDMWVHIGEIVCSEKHVDMLYEAFDNYISELYLNCCDVIEKRYAMSKLNAEELDYIINEQKATADRIRMAVKKYVVPGFDKINEQLPDRIQKAADAAERNIIAQIEDAPNAKMEEMQAYVNSHLLPYSIRRESKEIQSFIELHLDKVNQEVDDYLNKEVIEFNNRISIRLSTHTELAVRNIISKVTNRIGYNALVSYFSCFGGAGGANAGIANAASHLLKKIGNTFGKTFSRETHNALTHTLSKIGATSMKAVGAALTVIIELFMINLDYHTWKRKMKPKIHEAVENWRDETLPTIISDLEELKNQNISTIETIADDFSNIFENDISKQRAADEELMSQLELCDEIGKKLGVIRNERI